MKIETEGLGGISDNIENKTLFNITEFIII